MLDSIAAHSATNRTNGTLAAARRALSSFIESIQIGAEIAIESLAAVGGLRRRPALVPVPVPAHDVRPESGQSTVHDVCRYAAPMASNWSVLGFGTVNTGKTGHFQPPRFAP